MLSILLYGRNDAHGYNLHKRGALSLNALAAVLTDPDDEIIFVDYNTPDELPTFPEAIGDTLTDAAKARLRVIRVRPSYHRQFANRTRLFALEPQSRNIAARRANPANRWLLSTNTDMVFCPQEPEASLTSVVGGLQEGFYHLPRFEVPEGFWERLDRQDPNAAIAAMRAHGQRFHLNEIVWGIADNLFEAPGDFQLFTRQDYAAIEGFDERMLLGWHADSNVARRMRMLRGEVKNAFPAVAGYHCGHTRQATALHGGNRTQNDFEVFVSSIDDPVAHHQAGAWGAPDEVFEEIRLDRPDLYFPALTAAVPAEGPPVSEATYNDTSFGKIDAEPGRVLPHLCDLLFNLPPRQTIVFFGADAELLAGLRAFLETAGREATILALDADLDEALAAADIVILQNPSASMTPEAARLAAEWSAQKVFTRVCEEERARPPGMRRRIIVINGIHNTIANMVESTLAPTATPFATRLRQGFVGDDQTAAQRNPLEAPMYGRLGRTTPFTPQDRTLLEKVAASLQAGAPMAGWERLAPEIGAICSSPSPLPESFGFKPIEARAWAAAADAAMRANVARAVEAPVVTGPRATVSNRLLSGADWDDAAWSRLAVTYFGPGVLGLRERNRWVWERASLALMIQQLLPVTAAKAPRVLLLSSGPDYMAAVLTHLGYDVAYAAMDDFAAGRQSGPWADQLDLTSMVLPKPLAPHRPGVGGYDALLATLPSLFEASAADTDAVLAAAAPLMTPGALLVAAGTVQMNEVAYEGGLSFAEWRQLYDPAGPLGLRGFSPVGEIDLRVPLDTVVRFAFNDDKGETVAGLSYGFLRGFNTSALISARWPSELKSGPAARIEYGAVNRPDPATVAIPYTGGEAVLFDEALAAAAPAAQTAAFLARTSLLTAGREALAEAPRLFAGTMARNVLAHLRPLYRAHRTPLGLDLEAPGGAAFVLPVDATGCAGLRLDLDLPAGVTVTEAAVVYGWGGSPQVERDGDSITVRADNLGKVAFAVRLSAVKAPLTRLTLTPL